jgi:hypothetical protein
MHHPSRILLFVVRDQPIYFQIKEEVVQERNSKETERTKIDAM